MLRHSGLKKNDPENRSISPSHSFWSTSCVTVTFNGIPLLISCQNHFIQILRPVDSIIYLQREDDLPGQMKLLNQKEVDPHREKGLIHPHGHEICSNPRFDLSGTWAAFIAKQVRKRGRKRGEVH